MVMVGAASRLLPVKTETIERFITNLFSRKGEKIVNDNLKAFRAGREAAQQ
jgi:Pyruvate/2-oxoacid:ferredoxin oxidoreductase gamma subunit